MGAHGLLPGPAGCDGAVNRASGARLTSGCLISRLLDVSSRTTLTLDDDVAAGLRREALRTGAPFRTVVNRALRAGLEAPRDRPEPFRVDGRPLGLRLGIDLDDIEGLLDLLDRPARR